MKRFILLSLLFLAVSIFAQESVKFVTYGPSAATKEGDNDHYQIIFFKVPTELADSFFVRIYDADVGDRNDTRFGDFDSRTRFSLYGGAGTYSKIFGDTSLITEMKTSGKLIKTEEFGNDPFKDNKWYNFQTLKAPDGESIDGFSYFKLIVEGISGDDANIFDLTISTDEKKNILPNNSEIFSFYPSIRLPNKGIYAELRFFVNENIDAVTVHNFDLASANLNVVTPFRSNLAIPSSRQDEWLEGTVEIQNNEKNNINALIFEGGNEIPNDATFYLTDQNKSLIPVKHPIYIHKPNNRPIPSASGKILSDCYTVVFDASNSSDRDDDALDFYWKFGDGSTGEGVRIAHTYPELKDYQIELIVRDGSGQVGNSSLFNFSVKLNNPPQADAGNDLTIAPGAIVEFSGINSKDVDGSVINYVWDFGEGTKKEGLTVNHIYQNTGNYKVTLRVEDDSDSPCNFDTDQINVWVNAQPSVDVGDDIIGSVNEELTFNGSRSSDSDGELINYEWDFGDGSSGTGEITTHKYSSPGYYNVQLTVYDNSGVSNQSASDRLTVYVNDRPKAFAGNDRVVAVGESVSFNGSNSTDDTKLIGYDWDFGDGNQSSGVAVSHAYEKPGKYIVELTVTDDSKSISDKSSDELTVVVNFPPISVPGEDMYVSQSVVQFDGSKSSDEDGEIVAYLWEFGDGQTSSEPKPLHTYNLPGTYNVKLSVTDDSKTSTQTTSNQMMVIVNAPPVANAGLDRIAMPGQSIDFDGSGSVDSDGNIEIVEWDFGDGETGTGSSVSHSYKDPGIYLVGLKVADNSGHNSATDFDYLTVNVNAPPVAIAGNDIITAPGMEVIFDGSNSYDSDNEVTSFEWSFSDELYTSKSASMKRSFEAPGIYTAKLKVFDNSGAENPYADDELTIFVNNRPQAVIGENILSCSPVIFFDGSKSVDADGDALIYTWDFGDGEQGATGINVSHT
ncbi:MAG: PKD domain-containing protein, partial [Melioribacteraceae bacterium]|nr:PKD domain-containing protein [Melioribacteraceae bacterium]